MTGRSSAGRPSGSPSYSNRERASLRASEQFGTVFRSLVPRVVRRCDDVTGCQGAPVSERVFVRANSSARSFAHWCPVWSGDATSRRRRMPASTNERAGSARRSRRARPDVARAGPTAGYLADWGARVVRVEPPDPGGALLSDHDSSDYINLHRSTQLIQLDLRDDADRRRFFQLVGHADVIVENFRAPVKTELGIDYEACAAVNPRSSTAASPAMGRTVRRRQGGGRPDHPGCRRFDEHHRIARPGPVARRHRGVRLSRRPPARHRDSAGAAERADRARAMGEGLPARGDDLVPRLPGRALDDRRKSPPQEGNHHPTARPMGTYQAADGYLNVAAPGDGCGRASATASTTSPRRRSPIHHAGRPLPQPGRARRGARRPASRRRPA